MLLFISAPGLRQVVSKLRHPKSSRGVEGNPIIIVLQACLGAFIERGHGVCAFGNAPHPLAALRRGHLVDELRHVIVSFKPAVADLDLHRIVGQNKQSAIGMHRHSGWACFQEGVLGVVLFEIGERHFQSQLYIGRYLRFERIR